jgi:hypothetical protein
MFEVVGRAKVVMGVATRAVRMRRIIIMTKS